MADADSRARRQAEWLALASRRGAQARALWPLSLLYRALVALRRQAYVAGWSRVQRLPVPVIVVGNVVVGGAGKTPTTIALVQALKARGWRPGVVSRGHGRTGTEVSAVGPAASAEQVGDEPLLIRSATEVPVWVGRQRADAGRALLAAHPDVNVIVCDDGLQHWSLGRDLALAVFDDRGIGNGWLLPAGLLREPWPPRAGMAFAPDVVLHTGLNAPPLAAGQVMFSLQRGLISEARNELGTHMPLARLRDRPLVALAGIARPGVFFQALIAEGLTLSQQIALPDHAGPDAYARLVQSHPDAELICTEKDAVKLFPLLAGRTGTLRAWTVPLAVTLPPALIDHVDARLRQHATRQPA